METIRKMPIHFLGKDQSKVYSITQADMDAPQNTMTPVELVEISSSVSSFTPDPITPKDIDTKIRLVKIEKKLSQFEKNLWQVGKMDPEMVIYF